MSTIDPEIQKKMMNLLKEEEDKTDLENLAVLSRVGMKVADSVSSELDADAISASSTALIDLGLRLNQATDHGALTEILLHNTSGYSILMAINDEYIVFGGLRAVYRIGYYLGYLRELARKLNKLISGDKETEMVLSLETLELKKLEKQKEEEEFSIKKPSIEQDKAALDDLLGFLDDWEKDDEEFEELEALNETHVVSIPKSIGIEKEVKEAEIIKTPPSLVEESFISESQPGIEVYEDEIPPIPLDEYSPMDIEEEPVSEDLTPEVAFSPPEKAPPGEELPPLSELPSFEELAPPDFDIESSASEYDTEFVLEEESEALGSVLKELGWSEDED
jgi:predicted regulator of Ras-like GTPase activity (Roadblock/LC7/MglB family)